MAYSPEGKERSLLVCLDIMSCGEVLVIIRTRESEDDWTKRSEIFCSLSFLSSKIKCFCCWSLFFQCCERACIVENKIWNHQLFLLSLFVVFTLPWLLLGREHIQPQHVICTNAPSLVPCPFSQQTKKKFFLSRSCFSVIYVLRVLIYPVSSSFLCTLH